MEETKDNIEGLIREHSKETIRLLYSIVEEAPDAIQIADLGGRILFSNKAMERIYGFSPQELKGRHIDEMNVDKSFASKVILPGVKENGRWQGELMVKHKEGNKFPVWLAVSTVKDGNGHSVALIGIIRDISERKRAEEALLVSEEKFRVLAEQSITGTCLIQDGKFVYVNPRLAEMLGFRQEEMFGSSVLGLVAEYDRVMVTKNMKKRLSGEVSYMRYTFHALRKDGLEVELEVHGSTMTYLGKPAIMATLLDITDKRKAGEVLQHNYEVQCVINSILSLSVQDISLEGLFLHALELILSIPGLNIKGKGCIFLVEDKPEVLVMKAQKGFTEAVKKACTEVPFGSCLCGRAALSKKAIFSNDPLDKRHDFHHEDIFPHSHYCLPILSQNNVIGLINLYIEEGYEYNKRDEVFFNTIAYTLAGVIERKRMEEALRNSHDELECQVAKRTAELVEANKLLIQDVVERQQIEKHIRINNIILKLLSKMPSRKEYLDSIVKLIRGLSGCRCVGIRLLDERGQIPYESYIGFSRGFWESENWLSINRDQCACIRVIAGKPLIQDSPVMSKGGSFRCDNTIEFFSGLQEEEKSKFRGVCVKNGFASVAIIPISYRNRIIGAIHLADEGEDKVGIKIIELLESLTLLLGEGIHKFDLNDQIIQKQKELDDAKRLSDIGTLGAAVAHELRNPLAAMQMALYNIKRKSENQKLDKHIEHIETKIDESNQIINNLLFYSRIRMPNFEMVNMRNIINECVAIARKRSLKSKASISKKIEFLKGISIEADPLQMKELFTNVLNNSLDSLSENKGKIEISGGLLEQDFVKININDNGSGIEEGDLKRIFEPFFTTKARGVGLGLTVCNQIVQLHKGTINIESNKPKGTAATITLPIRRRINPL